MEWEWFLDIDRKNIGKRILTDVELFTQLFVLEQEQMVLMAEFL